jgi:hypothetical protein
MRTKLVIGSLVAVSLLILLPTTSAIESNAIDLFDFPSIEEKIKDGATGNPLIDSMLMRLVGLSMVLAAFVYLYVTNMVPSI